MLEQYLDAISLFCRAYIELPGVRPVAVAGELTDPENKEPLKSLVSAPKFNARKGFSEVPRCENTEQSKYQLG